MSAITQTLEPTVRPVNPPRTELRLILGELHEKHPARITRHPQRPTQPKIRRAQEMVLPTLPAEKSAPGLLQVVSGDTPPVGENSNSRSGRNPLVILGRWVGAAALALTLGTGVGIVLADLPFVGPTVSHAVAPGETLWEIAASNGEAGTDIRTTMRTIQELNGLTGTELNVGQQLAIPAP